jgi:uncharacterized protein YndB with AHSA1/START domain
MNEDTVSRGAGGEGGGRGKAGGARVGDARVNIGGRLLTGVGPRPGPPPVLRFDQYVPHPPAAVWRALTDADLLAHWWASGDVRAVVGHRFTLDLGAWGVQPCEVTAVEPERLLEYHFAEGVLDTTITWRLEPENDGTRLHLVHGGFDLDSLQGRLAYAGMGNGWPHVLNGVERALDAVSARS